MAKRWFYKIPCGDRSSLLPRVHRLKYSGLFGQNQNRYFCLFFSRKPNSFRGPRGFCRPIWVTAALLGRLLPSDGHKLVKKTRKFRPKSAPDRPFFDQSRYFKFVWWAVSFAQGNSNLKYFGASRSCQGPDLGESHRSRWRTYIHTHILHLRNEGLCGSGATGGFLKIAHTKKKILVQIFGPKIQAQN